MSDEVKDLDYWAVNEERFRLHIRDQIIVSSVRSRHGENSAAIVNAMLQISQLHFSPTKDETQCITIQEIHHIVNRTIQITFRVSLIFLRILFYLFFLSGYKRVFNHYERRRKTDSGKW